MNEIDYTLVDTAIANKDVFTTLIVLFIVIFFMLVLIIPLIWKTNKRNDKLLNDFIEHSQENAKNLSNIYNEIKNHNNMSEKQFEFLRQNLNNTTLNDEQSVRLFKWEMWLTSKKKLNFIKDILINNHVKWREDFIREKVTLWLSWYSQEYLTNFKWYTTNIWDLWKWLDDNFWKEDFKIFVKEITDVMFRRDVWEKMSCINNKMSEIALIMETLQNKLWLKLRDDLISKK